MNANDVLGGLVEKATKTTRPAKLVSNLETVPSGYRAVAHGYHGDLCIFPEQPCNRLTLADELLFIDAVNALPLLLDVVAKARKAADDMRMGGAIDEAAILDEALARLDEGVRP